MGKATACGPVVTTNYIDSLTAQSRAYECFFQDFMRRHPKGEVLTEYEYLGKTTFAGAGGTAIRYSGKPWISKLISSMSVAFRKFEKFADFRKPDGIGFVENGRSVLVELLEVTTEKNQQSAKKQLLHKKDTLLTTVVPHLEPSFTVDVIGTPWKPSGWQTTCNSTPDIKNKETVRWVCYLPTLRNKLPDGVILYEVHASNSMRDPVNLPVLSPETQAVIKRDVAKARAKREAAEIIGQRVPITDPTVGDEIARIAKIVGMSAAIGLVAAACVATVMTPIPGDEVVVGAFALKLVENSMRVARVTLK